MDKDWIPIDRPWQISDAPTTDKYNLEVRSNLKDPKLSDSFYEAVHGEQKPGLSKVIDSVLGKTREDRLLDVAQSVARRDFSAEYSEDGENNYSASYAHLTLAPISIKDLMRTYPDNLPPNIPHNLNQNLLEHIVTLHETEHVTQNKIEHVEGRGFFIVSNVHNVADSIEKDWVHEMDADLAVVKYLECLGYFDVAQFWLDGILVNSFTGQFPLSGAETLIDDVSSTIAHYSDTGEVLDFKYFALQKLSLLTKVQVEMNASHDEMNNIIQDYPDFLSEVPKEFIPYFAAKPQGVMHAVQTLLDKGDLKDMEKWEAENYMAAMERLGYEPDPNYSYSDQLRDTLENKMGLAPDSTQTENTASILYPKQYVVKSLHETLKFSLEEFESSLKEKNTEIGGEPQEAMDACDGLKAYAYISYALEDVAANYAGVVSGDYVDLKDVEINVDALPEHASAIKEQLEQIQAHLADRPELEKTCYSTDMAP